MARAIAEFPRGSRITDYISLGLIAKVLPREKLQSVLAETGKESLRHQELPAHGVIYYVIALALYMNSPYREVLRCLLEGVQWLQLHPSGIKMTGNSGSSQARSRLGSEPQGTDTATGRRHLLCRGEWLEKIGRSCVYEVSPTR